MMDLFVGSADGPAVIKRELAVNAPEFPDEACPHRLAEVTEMGSPTSVLVHRESNTLSFCSLDQPLTEIKIENERFLTQDVFTGFDGGFDDLSAGFGVYGGIDDLEVIPAHHVTVIGHGVCIRIELIPAGAGAGGVDVADDGDVEFQSLISSEMVFGDSSSTYETDLGAVSLRSGRQIGKDWGDGSRGFDLATEAVRGFCFGHRERRLEG
jgi:hypothetical protein